MAMTQVTLAIVKVPTTSPQPGRGRAVRRAKQATAGRPAAGRVLASWTGRTATRGGGEVMELEHGITVKKGTATVGVQRQYTGTAGRIENAQVSG
jgi:hypothetical protein